MNNMNRNQENDRNPQNQGGRTEETREGRETMRGANVGERGFSSGQTNDLPRKEDEDSEEEDLDEASLDSTEEEDEMDLGGAEGSDIGVNRNRDKNQDQSARI